MRTKKALTAQAHTIQYTLFKAIVRPCEGGGYWATIPELSCNTDGESLHEVERNMYEAVSASIGDFPEVEDYMIEFEVRDA